MSEPHSAHHTPDEAQRRMRPAPLLFEPEAASGDPEHFFDLESIDDPGRLLDRATELALAFRAAADRATEFQAIAAAQLADPQALRRSAAGRDRAPGRLVGGLHEEDGGVRLPAAQTAGAAGLNRDPCVRGHPHGHLAYARRVPPVTAPCPGFVRFAGSGPRTGVDLSVMSDLTWDIRNGNATHTESRSAGVPRTGDRHRDPMSHTEHVTADGAEWLASASAFPRSVRALWTAHPAAPSVLPCGTVFDVVNLSALFGRRVLDRLWSDGPGCGPVAVRRGRILLFAVPGTADRLPSLLAWEEWGRLVPPPLCHGAGDEVTLPPLVPGIRDAAEADGTRWVVAPGVRQPWLPGAAVLLWACLRAARPKHGRLASADHDGPGQGGYDGGNPG